MDGLKGFPQAIESVYPQTTGQLCIVHLVRGSLPYVNRKERRTVAQDLRAIYQATTVAAAEQERELFAARWDQKHPTISALWRRHGEQITPLFAFPFEIRKIIYATTTTECLVKSRSHIPITIYLSSSGSPPHYGEPRSLIILGSRVGSCHAP